MQVKKFLVSLLVLSSLGLASCNKEDPKPDPKPVEPVEPEKPDVPAKLTDKECYDIFLETLSKENAYDGDKSLYTEKQDAQVETILDSNNKEVKGDDLKAIIGDRQLESESSNKIAYYSYSKKDNDLLQFAKKKDGEYIDNLKYYFDNEGKSYVYNDRYGRQDVEEVNKEHIKKEGYGLEFATRDVLDNELIRYDSMEHLKKDFYDSLMLLLGVSKEDATNVNYEFKVGEFENRFIINAKLFFDYTDNKYEAHLHIEYDRNQITSFGLKASQSFSTRVEGHEGYKDQFKFSLNYKATFKHSQGDVKLTDEQKTNFKKGAQTANKAFGGTGLFLKRTSDYDFFFNPELKSGSLDSEYTFKSLENVPHVKFNLYKKGSDTPLDASTLKYTSYTDIIYFDFEIEDGYALVYDDTGDSEFITIAINDQPTYTIYDNSSNLIYVNDKKVSSDEIKLENQKFYYVADYSSGKK